MITSVMIKIKAMKKFLITVGTNWCGTNQTYRAEAESESELWDTAERLAYDNFESYDLWEDIAGEEGYDPDEMSKEDWDALYGEVDVANYYSWDVEEFDDSDEEWELYGGKIYNKYSY